MDSLIIKGLCKQFELSGQKLHALDQIDLNLKQGSFVTIVGRSGCGKTTLLRLIAGIEKPSSGMIELNPPNSKVGFVFQEPRLLPWLTVEENLLAVLPKSLTKDEKVKQVSTYLEMLGLQSFRKAYPHQLSGGMAQRVALGRALCFGAEIILMDEPLSALDAFTRRALQDELIKVFQAGEKTVLFVTHDVEEALHMGQRVLVMEQGRIAADFAVDPKQHEQQRKMIFASIAK